MRVYYYNGDMKETHSNGLVRYLYSNSHTWHTTEVGGREVTEFSNGQREVTYSEVNTIYVICNVRSAMLMGRCTYTSLMGLPR